MVVNSRRVSCRENHSIWSAYTLGVAISMVAGRLRMISRPSSGCHTSETASHTSTENGSSVPVKISGLYSYPMIVWPSTFSLCFMTSSVPRTAMSLISSLVAWKTTRRNNGASAL